MSDCPERQRLVESSSAMTALGAVVATAGAVVIAAGSAGVITAPGAVALGSIIGAHGGVLLAGGALTEHYANFVFQCPPPGHPDNPVVIPIPPLAGGGGDGVPGSYGYYDNVEWCYERRSGPNTDDGSGIVVTATIWVRTLDPIVLDLDGNGISYQSQQFAHDYAGADGRHESIHWVSPGDGILVYDWNRDGVGQAEEWALVSFVPGARTDLEALRAFDTNGDGVFDVNDAAFADFRVGIDANGDGRLGAGELHTLAAAGVASINLTASSHSHGAEVASGVFLNETGAFTRTNGQTGLFHSVGFEAKAVNQLVHSDGFAGIVSQGTANAFVAQSDTSISADLRWYSYAGRTFVDFFGGGGADYIVGTEVDNVLSGGSGVDQIHGLGGNDFILADAADILYGVIKGGSGTDVLYLTESVGATVYAHAHEVEAIIGSAGDDVLSGEWSADIVLDGGKGNDTLIGSSGNDVLIRSEGQYDGAYGGAGDDLYLVTRLDGSQGQNMTYIFDSQGHDTLFLQDFSREEMFLSRSGNSLYLSLSDGSTLTLNDAFWGASVDLVVFKNGSSVTVDDLILEYYDHWDAPVLGPNLDYP